jgi:hypothetical protein
MFQTYGVSKLSAFFGNPQWPGPEKLYTQQGGLRG